MTHPPSGLQLTAPRFSMTGRMVAMSPGEDGLIGIPFPEHSSELLSRLNAQRRSGLLCDLTLTSRGARYPTHRSVMAAVSLYFRRLFGAEEGVEGGEGGEGVGGSCSVCQLDCVSPDALDALLEFAYTATLTIRSSGMREVLEGAQLLGIQCVADACRHILGEAAEETPSPAEDARRATSRRKQDRRNVAKTASPMRPAWGDTRSDIKQHTPEYDLPPTPDPNPTPEREEQPLPAAGQNGAVRSSHQGAVLNGSAHWPLVMRTPVPQPPEDLPSEDEESRGQGPVASHHTPPQAEMAVGRAVEGGVRKRKSQTPQQCPVCQKIIHGAGKLPRHMRTHTGEKPFQCTACGVRFTRNDKLKIHMRKHTGERPYPCTSCPARFLHSYDLKNHLSLHSGDRPYECPLCHKAFAREDHLQRHRKGHSCLEPRRPRRGPEAHVSPPADPPLCLHQPSAPSSSSASQFPFQQGPVGSGGATHGASLLGPGGMNYPSLLWRAAQSRRGAGHTLFTQPQWEEEEEDEENGEEEES
ncbi:zinc finger and BTB domain-containing protein 7B isoform X1 [Electrophorus electricus]|uniref:Zinc finger and BTB domain containing 7B n=2 Tax=Electrophorus electricus TaxID=8005 RepID=A0A4W4EA67_ELEEL|nr:zinc finger and BTB domain-containing protein 7B isoform X1 [Electrophorus electricus]XP_035386354.1 zinc finger and BTB domain-containing protein 7B isoform X1 [Electrophorus electricus]